SAEFQKKQKVKFQRALSRAIHVVVPSAHVAEQLSERAQYPKDRISVIAWGGLSCKKVVNEERSEPPFHSLVDAYLAKKRKFVLCVGNLEVRKNHKLLFRAMEHIKDVD